MQIDEERAQNQVELSCVEIPRLTRLFTFHPLEELIMAVRRQSQGFARGSSGYRGVTLHPTGRWEARIGLPGQKHVYLGLFETEVEAARAYDVKLVELRGPSMATNFAISNYAESIKLFYEENSDAANESTESTPLPKEAKSKKKKEVFFSLMGEPYIFSSLY